MEPKPLAFPVVAKKARRRRRLPKLDQLGGILRELAYLYRAGVNREMDSGDVSRLASVLLGMRAVLESTDLQRRLDTLEATHGTR